jgi:tetratricopeptide (TPR) repeat protein
LRVLFALALVAGEAEAADPARQDARSAWHGETQLAERKWSAATVTFRRLLRSRPDWGRARIGLGRALAGQGRCDDALEILDPLRGHPDWTSEASVSQGECQARVGDGSAAIASFEDAAVLDQSDPWPLFLLGLQHAERGEAADTVAALERAAALDDGSTIAALLRCEAARLEGADEPWLALDELRAGIADRALSPEAAIQADVFEARLWLDLGDVAHAERLLRAIVEREPMAGPPRAWLGEVVRRAGSPDETLAMIGSGGGTRGEGSLVENVRARALFDRGEHDAAWLALRAADPAWMATMWTVEYLGGGARPIAPVSSNR